MSKKQNKLLDVQDVHIARSSDVSCLQDISKTQPRVCLMMEPRRRGQCTAKKKSDGERGTKFFRDNSFETRQENHLHQFQIAENTKLLDPHETPQHIQLQGFWVSWQALVEVAQVSLLEVLLAHQGAHLGAIFTVAASLLTMSYPPNSVCYQLSVPCKLGDTKGHSKSPT